MSREPTPEVSACIDLSVAAVGPAAEPEGAEAESQEGSDE